MHKTFRNAYTAEAHVMSLLDDLVSLGAIAYRYVCRDALDMSAKPGKRFVALCAMGGVSVPAGDDKRKAATLPEFIEHVNQLWFDLIAPGLFAREFALVKVLIQLYFFHLVRPRTPTLEATSAASIAR